MELKQQTKFKRTEIGMIPEDWDVVKQKDVARFINGRAYSYEEFRESGTPLVRIQNLTGTKEFVYSDLQLEEEKYIDEGDLIYAWSATFGPYIWKGPRTIFHYHIWKVICDEAKLDKFFFYYKLKHISNRISDTGTGSIFTHITKKLMEDSQISLPPSISEQQSIAKILSDLDSKIELNQQMNKTLEAIGQAIFKHWFIDFEFPNEEGKPYKSSGGEMVYNEKLGKKIPKYWNVDNLGNHTIIKGRIGWKGLQVSEYTAEGPFIVGGLQIKDNRIMWEECSHITETRYEESPEIMLQESDILMTKDGTIGKLAYVTSLPGKATVAAHIHVIRKKTERVSQLFLYYFFKTKGFQNFVESRISGSVVPALTQKNINGIPVVLPNSQILSQFDWVANYLQHKIAINSEISLMLTKIRDSLLPKLMLGKIRVPVPVN